MGRAWRIRLDRGLWDYYLPKLRTVLFSQRTNKKIDFAFDQLAWPLYFQICGIAATSFTIWYIWGIIPRNHNKAVLDSYKDRGKL